MTRKIALKEHFARPELFAYAHRPGSSTGGPGFKIFEDRLLDFGAMCLATMDKAGIELAVLSVNTPGVQAETDARVAIRRAQEANDFLAREVEKRPSRYAGFAHLALQDPKVAAEELSRCVRELGFKSAMVNGHSNGHYLDEDAYHPFWERVLFSVDYPYQDSEEAAEFIETAPVSEGVRAKICHRNAERVLGLSGGG